MPGRIIDRHDGRDDDQGPLHPHSDDVGSSTEHNNEPLTDEGEVSVSQEGNEGHLSASDSGNSPGTSGSRSPAPGARIPGDSTRAQNGSHRFVLLRRKCGGGRLTASRSMTEDSRNESEQSDNWNMSKYLQSEASSFLESELGRRPQPRVNDLPGLESSSQSQVPSSAASDAPLADTRPEGGLDNRFVNGDGPNPVVRPNQVCGPGAYYRVDVSLDSDSDVAEDDNPRGPETTSHGSG